MAALGSIGTEVDGPSLSDITIVQDTIARLNTPLYGVAVSGVGNDTPTPTGVGFAL